MYIPRAIIRTIHPIKSTIHMTCCLDDSVVTSFSSFFSVSSSLVKFVTFNDNAD
jgi:hypothetical protein